MGGVWRAAHFNGRSFQSRSQRMASEPIAVGMMVAMKVFSSGHCLDLAQPPKTARQITEASQMAFPTGFHIDSSFLVEC